MAFHCPSPHSLTLTLFLFSFLPCSLSLGGIENGLDKHVPYKAKHSQKLTLSTLVTYESIH